MQNNHNSQKVATYARQNDRNFQKCVLVRCSVLQCVAVCCGVLQCVARELYTLDRMNSQK